MRLRPINNYNKKNTKTNAFGVNHQNDGVVAPSIE